MYHFNNFIALLCVNKEIIITKYDIFMSELCQNTLQNTPKDTIMYNCTCLK